MHEGKYITLLGDKLQLPQPAQFHHIKRLLHMDAIDALFIVEITHPKTHVNKILPYMQTYNFIITEVCTSFRYSFWITPPWDHDHVIPFIEGALAVKIRPY